VRCIVAGRGVARSEAPFSRLPVGCCGLLWVLERLAVLQVWSRCSSWYETGVLTTTRQDTMFRSYTSRTALKLHPSGVRLLQCRSGGPCGDTLPHIRHEEFSSLLFLGLVQSFKLWRCERLRLVQRCAASCSGHTVRAECSWPFYAGSRNCEQLLLASSCLSVRPHRITEPPLDGASWNFILGYF